MIGLPGPELGHCTKPAHGACACHAITILTMPSWKSASVFRTAGQQQHQAAPGIVDVVVCQVGKVSFSLQIDMNASSGVADGGGAC